jgi:hypothetical protein
LDASSIIIIKSAVLAVAITCRPLPFPTQKTTTRWVF